MRFLRSFLLLFFLFATSKSFAQNLDVKVLKSINEHATSFKTNFFCTDAKTVTIMNIAAPATLLTTGLIKHDKKLIKEALYMTGSFVLSSVITQGTKLGLKRTRPCDEYKFITKRGTSGGYSFVSGHTSAAFNTATSLSLIFPKWYVVVPAYLWAGSIGYARVYQGVHYPSDVLAGAIVGAGSAWVGYKMQKWMTAKKHKIKTT